MAKTLPVILSTAKKAAGKAAAAFIQPDMVVGLGTGSTASCFIESLIERCKQGLKITTVATSERSKQQALEGGLTLIDINSINSIDMTVDGADEIDPQKRMIKGGGGALLREKIVACMSREMVVIVDSSKVVDHLGRFHLPVEIVKFAHRGIIYKLEQLGYKGNLRKSNNDYFFVTDSGNYIYDIHLQYPCLNPEEDHRLIRSVSGVVETGFFFKLAGRVVVGFDDGHVEIH